MVKLLRNAALFLIFFTLISLQFAAAKRGSWFRKDLQAPKSLGAQRVSHLHFYFHDTVSGQNQTAVSITRAAPTANASATQFGLIRMMDDPLTEGPDPTSKLIGRAQGLYALSSLQESSLLMAVDYVFLDGEHKGSTLSILGRNAVFHKVREMPVVGGTGTFRLARGYAIARTHSFTSQTAVVEYNVVVIHY
ncbi:dirigent protein 1-like [Nymphaea colorata]|uniref:Dirigent protein n=1 Tax=Nymphaea colorata TaxID=210225 RepID=A0A5K0ZEC9_9MAGN|nr:dirigent protein 1-like [Nymphaea colorata]